MVRVEKPLEPSGSGGFSLSGPPGGSPRVTARCRHDPRPVLAPCLCRALPRATIELTPTVPAFDHPMKKRVIRAEEFEVLDAAGRVRLRIGLSNDESPFFSMLDAEGQVRARFGLSSDGSAGLA